jgi:hypothetical protein
MKSSVSVALMRYLFVAMAVATSLAAHSQSRQVYVTNLFGGV